MSEITWTFVNRLVDAWKKYEANFGEPPHGTQIQIAALVELAGGEASLCSLPATGAGGETPICDAQYEATARISSEVASPAAIAFLQLARQLELALKSAEAAGMDEVALLKTALRFYARKYHFELASPDAWDTVSGEPQNYYCDEAGTATVEDGSIAKLALLGQSIDWKSDGEDVTPQPLEAEKIRAAAKGG